MLGNGLYCFSYGPLAGAGAAPDRSPSVRLKFVVIAGAACHFDLPPAAGAVATSADQRALGGIAAAPARYLRRLLR